MLTRFDVNELFTNLQHHQRDVSPASFTGKTAFILTDQPIPASTIELIGPVINTLDGLTDQQIKESVFYIYFNCDSDALPHLRRIVDLTGTFVPHLCFWNTDYRFVNRYCADALAKTWVQGHRISHLSPSTHENICEALEITRHLTGDFVEIGAYLGGSALTAMNYMSVAGIKRNSWVLDTWQGFEYSQAQTSPDAIWFNTHQLMGPEETKRHVAQTLSAAGTDFHLITNNICTDPLPEDITKIAVANIDVDMYEPTMAALEKVSKLLVVGGIIIVEDPTSTPGLYGAYLALEKFVEMVGHKYYKLFKGSQYYLIRMS